MSGAESSANTPTGWASPTPRPSSPSARAARRCFPPPRCRARTGADVWVKFEGMNPTGSFKDRGMTMAVSRGDRARREGRHLRLDRQHLGLRRRLRRARRHHGRRARARGQDRDGQAQPGGRAQRRSCIQIRGNFDDCLEIARELADHYPVHLVNSVNPDRIEGQKTAAYEVVEVLGDAPDFHFIPVGNAGNYTAYSRGYREEARRAASPRACPACSASRPRARAPLVRGEIVKNPETIASAIRIGNPASWELALEAREATDGYFGAIDDDRDPRGAEAARRPRSASSSSPRPRSASRASSTASRPASSRRAHASCSRSPATA